MRRGGPAAAFVAAVLVAAAISFAVPDHLKVAGFGTPSSESARTTERLTHALGYDPEPGMVVLARSPNGFATPSQRSAIGAVAAQVARDRDVGHVQTPFGRGGNRILLSKDRREALVLVHFRAIGEQGASKAIDRIRGDVHSPSLRLRYGGFDVGFLDANKVVREDLLRAELIAFPVLALLLIMVFRGLTASLLPLVIGGISVLGTFAALRLLSHVLNISVYALNLSAALGLGLAVNAGLFLVARYREEAALHGRTHKALQLTMSRAGRAVFYTGLTVAGACSALLLFPQQFIYSMGIGGVITALLSAAAALIVVPALLPFVAYRHRIRSDPALGTGFWYRFSHWVMRHPIAVAVASAIAILAAGYPAHGVTWTFLDAKALPPSLESRKVVDTIKRDFVPNLEFPITVAVSPGAATSGDASLRLQQRIASLAGAGIVSNVARAPDGTGLIQLLTRGEPLAQPSQDVVRELRSLGPQLSVGGRIADFVDLKSSIEARAPPAALVVVASTLIVMFLLTGSVVLPIKALLMNALTLAAVFGGLVLIFQDGFLGIRDLLGFTGPDAIETAISVVIVGVTLGLATDYSILLLSRVREEHDYGQPNEEAVATGLERSGRVITNAAVFQAVAQLAMASSRVFVVKELAIGIAIGVAIDATIVRACLVPSLMRILGQINWWAPRPLRVLNGRLDRAVGAMTGRRAGRYGLGQPAGRGESVPQ